MTKSKSFLSITGCVLLLSSTASSSERSQYYAASSTNAAQVSGEIYCSPRPEPLVYDCHLVGTAVP